MGGYIMIITKTSVEVLTTHRDNMIQLINDRLSDKTKKRITDEILLIEHFIKRLIPTENVDAYEAYQKDRSEICLTIGDLNNAK